MKSNYIILSESNSIRLENIVNKYLELGYTCQGGVSCIISVSGSDTWSQAMIKN